MNSASSVYWKGLIFVAGGGGHCHWYQMRIAKKTKHRKRVCYSGVGTERDKGVKITQNGGGGGKSSSWRVIIHGKGSQSEDMYINFDLKSA